MSYGICVYKIQKTFKASKHCQIDRLRHYGESLLLGAGAVRLQPAAITTSQTRSIAPAGGRWRRERNDPFVSNGGAKKRFQTYEQLPIWSEKCALQLAMHIATGMVSEEVKY